MGRMCPFGDVWIEKEKNHGGVEILSVDIIQGWMVVGVLRCGQRGGSESAREANSF